MATLSFSYVGHLCSLRSFPTRRSSDLGGQVQLLADKFIKHSKLKIEKIPYKGAAELATALLTGDLQLSFFAYSAGAPFLKEDRKSTRLNSSHLVISYAVFCLKKKIMNN